MNHIVRDGLTCVYVSSCNDLSSFQRVILYNVAVVNGHLGEK